MVLLAGLLNEWGLLQCPLIVLHGHEAEIVDWTAGTLLVELLLVLPEEHRWLDLVANQLELAGLCRLWLRLLWEGQYLAVHVSDLVLVANGNG